MNEPQPLPPQTPNRLGEPDSWEPPYEAIQPVPMQPVQLGERIEILDVLRGFALFGILCVNMQFYTTPLLGMISGKPWWEATHDQAATFAIKLLAEGKFYILFSFLFGLGITIQMTRAHARGADFVGHHAKRMLVLLSIGLVHAYLFWMGDILQTYAVLGLLCMALVWLRPWVLGIIAGLVYSGTALLSTAFVLFGILTGGSGGPTPDQAFQAYGYPSPEEAIRIYSSGTFGEVMKLRAMEVILGYFAVATKMGGDIITMFILGVCAVKLRVFEELPRWRGFFRRLRWPALAVGLLGNLAYANVHWLTGGNQASWFMLLVVWGHALGAPALTFFYVATFVGVTEEESWQRRLKPIAYVGRMALTNYLLQTLICTTLFYSHGFGLYAAVGPLAGLGLTVLIYVVQIPFSVLWLRHFRFGPMEWLWRTLTYGKLQPVRLDPA